MKSLLLKFKSLLTIIFRWLALAIILSMLLITAGQVLLRNFFGVNLSRAGEFARQEVIWLTFTGAILTTLNSKHIGIDLLSRILTGKAQKLLGIILNVSAAIICLIFTYYSINFLKMEIEFAATIADIFPAWMFQVIIPAGFLIMAIAFLLNLIDDEKEIA
ncbi:MAG: TRAP transporter small permease [Fidelibacterota bacterium]